MKEYADELLMRAATGFLRPKTQLVILLLILLAFTSVFWNYR